MSRKIAIKTAAIAVALGTMTSVAWAELMELTDAQMDQVAAGVGVNQTHWNYRVLPAAPTAPHEVKPNHN